MGLLNVAGFILSSMFDSAASTYSNLSRSDGISDDNRDECISRADQLRSNRDSVRRGDYSFLFNSNDEDYD